MASPTKRVRADFPRFSKTSERKHITPNRGQVNENPKGDPNVPDHFNREQLQRDRLATN